VRVESLDGLPGCRLELHDALTARADALFELVDALLCAEGPVKSLVELSLAAEHRRGHGALYDAVGTGRIDLERLRVAVGALTVPRARDGRITLAVDVSDWLRPDAAVSPERLFCSGEALAGILRPGRAGSNPAADHIEVLDAALAQIPDAHRHGSPVLKRLRLGPSSGGWRLRDMPGHAGRGCGRAPVPVVWRRSR
jgi:hypothetical protein